MKKSRFILLVGLASIFYSCSSDMDKNIEQGSLRIRLGVNTNSYTRSAINSINDLVAHGNKVGIIAVETANPNAANVVLTTDWTPSPLMSNVQTTSITTSGVIHWADDYNYPVEENRYVKFCAYYPYVQTGVNGNTDYAVLSNGNSPIVHFQIDGSKDLMIANPVIGNRYTNPGNLVFRHLLTQLQFQLIDAGGSFMNQSITEIRFPDLNVHSTMNVETGALGQWNNKLGNSLIYNQDQPGYYPRKIIHSTELNPQVLPGSIMLQPGLSKFDIILKIKDQSGTEREYPVEIVPISSGDTTFAAGKSYMISLYFVSLTTIRLTATVMPWEFGGTGEGILE